MRQTCYTLRIEPTFAMTPTLHPAEGYFTGNYAYWRNALNRAVREARLWAYTGPNGEQETLATVTIVQVHA